MLRIAAMRPVAAALTSRALSGIAVRGEPAATESEAATLTHRVSRYQTAASHASHLTRPALTVTALHSSGSTLLAAAGALPLVAVRLQPHRWALQRSRTLSVPPPPQQQVHRGQPFTLITPPLQSTPVQPLDPCGRLSHLNSRLQSSRHEDSEAHDLLSQPQERGWVGVGTGIAAVIALLLAKGTQQREKIRFAGAAAHWDLQAYKPGGGLSHSPSLPATKTSSSSDLRVLVDGLPSYLLQYHRLRESALRRADTRISVHARLEAVATACG